ncbi:hypothetical protein HDF26_004605 [Pedobacter cryoconitis]|uniref:hypothetical protein n=1 Tax=Pedobacter cryoconitis TaxID=188932 RepID=UPI00161D39E4|nr:hypothetical protein [Pedobacter cryoconitis]MBB6274132.1 hypothetical protein [Pedobacter cryoconitis]
MTNIFKHSAAGFFVAATLTLSLLLQSCSETPDKFFGIAILNTNNVARFATPALARQIDGETVEFADRPSTKKKGDEALNSVKNQILVIEKALKDVKALNAGGERKEIQDEAIGLYEFVLPVYKNEYTDYAKLCDARAPQEQKDKIIKAIQEKYNSAFEKKYSALLKKGKAFAEENNLNVTW